CSGDPLTGASDQYSLAVATYQMLSGRVPFVGETVIDIVKKHCLDRVPPLRDLQPDLAPHIAGVVEKALAKKPDDRFSSVTSFAKALDLAARGVDVVASYPDSSDPMRAAETLIIDPRTQKRIRRKVLAALASAATDPSRRQPLVLGGGLVVVLAAVTFATQRIWLPRSGSAAADSARRTASMPGAL